MKTKKSKDIETIILNAVKNFNKGLSFKNKIKVTTRTPLLGAGSQLDSLDFVNCILQIEQALNDALGCPIVLADEKAFSLKNSPFQSIEALSLYVQKNFMDKT